jgi:hypothetical protein
MGDLPVKLVGSEAASKPSFDKSWASPRAPSENPEFFMKERRFKSE